MIDGHEQMPGLCDCDHDPAITYSISHVYSPLSSSAKKHQKYVHVALCATGAESLAPAALSGSPHSQQHKCCSPHFSVAPEIRLIAMQGKRYKRHFFFDGMNSGLQSALYLGELVSSRPTSGSSLARVPAQWRCSKIPTGTRRRFFGEPESKKTPRNTRN